MGMTCGIIMCRNAVQFPPPSTNTDSAYVHGMHLNAAYKIKNVLLPILPSVVTKKSGEFAIPHKS